jgi:DNA uptake protein ComE-like DNA-binding protein
MKQVPWWVWAAVMPFGFGAWAPVVPGIQLRRWTWIALGLCWCALVLTGGVGDDVAGLDDNVAGNLIVVGWIGALATALTIRPVYLREVSSAFRVERAAAERRLQERRDALRLAEQRPDLARELGVGRPDRPGAQAAGVVDVNSAPPNVLVELPGVDDAVASRIVEIRRELNGFSSLHELGDLLDLDGNQVERLRDRVVFLPR